MVKMQTSSDPKDGRDRSCRTSDGDLCHFTADRESALAVSIFCVTAILILTILRVRGLCSHRSIVRNRSYSSSVPKFALAAGSSNKTMRRRKTDPYHRGCKWGRMQSSGSLKQKPFLYFFSHQDVLFSIFLTAISLFFYASIVIKYSKQCLNLFHH